MFNFEGPKGDENGRRRPVLSAKETSSGGESFPVSREEFPAGGSAPEIRGCSSVGRAPALQAGGRQFESVHLHHGCAEQDALESDGKYYLRVREMAGAAKRKLSRVTRGGMTRGTGE